MFSRILTNAYKINKLSKFYNSTNSFSTQFVKDVAPKQIINTEGSLFKNNIKNHHIRLYNAAMKRSYNTRMPKTPELIYIPHFARWLRTKLQLKKLQKTWDPEFTEGVFIYGTSKAVCRITEIIHENKPEELQGLLTTSAKIKLMDDMTTRLTKTQRSIIKIKPEDIKILVPTTVNLNKEGNQRNCRVGMRVLALKWIQQQNGALRLVLIVLQTEFLKYYTNGTSSDWTISAFDILECAVLTQAPT